MVEVEHMNIWDVKAKIKLLEMERDWTHKLYCQVSDERDNLINKKEFYKELYNKYSTLYTKECVQSSKWRDKAMFYTKCYRNSLIY